MTEDVVIVHGQRRSSRWGLFTQDGQKAFVADSVLSVDYEKEYSIPTYPLETGAFESYNKVERPYLAHLIVTKSGTHSEKKQFQDRLEELAASRELFKLETPEQVYDNANVVKISVRRGAEKGASLLVVELQIQQVRVTATQKFVTIAPIIDSGALQTQDPPDSVDVDARPPQ